MLDLGAALSASSGVNSAGSQHPGSVSGSGASDGGACAAADVPYTSSAKPEETHFSSVRWEGIADTIAAGTDRTVQQVQGASQSHFLALTCLVVDLNRRTPLRTDYELARPLEATESLWDVVDALAPISRSRAPWEDEIS
ncbi:unnamed protein product [Phytophthora fragariaefolia]|uniref:Unnamed protein product n=1 Tax=Phytophthora fragariaefolia TaxID=1490495 RepID=A0A9W6YPS5_9STRA|nr:unnamed protein product [Phytophthora fragariaefolia]